MSLKYRPDIDGLRALAVVSVVIFHVNAAWLPGGFVGVDIFFVISGFLITSILYRGMEAGTFSFKRFYLRRIQRILPASYLVLFATLAMGCLLMVPVNLKALTKAAISAAFFGSNIFFARGAGYFEDTSELPLLHTWSLAVEEQYYFLFPPLLLLLFRFGLKKRGMLLTCIVLGLASFAVSSWMTTDKMLARWNYFLLPTRAGEMLIGSVLAVANFHGVRPGARLARAFSLTGFALMVIAFFVLSKHSPFPGYNAAWPCIGTGMVIYGSRESIINRGLSLRPVVYIGLISYSVYLWHWPILAFMRYTRVAEDPMSVQAGLVAIGLTWLLAHLTWKFVETPTRKQKLSLPQAATRYFVIPATVVALVFVSIRVSDGWPARFGDDVEMLTHLTPTKTCHGRVRANCDVQAAEVRDASSNRGLLVGDSHAGHLTGLFTALAEDGVVSVDQLSANDRAPDGALTRSPGRSAKMIEVFQQVAPNYDVIYLSIRLETRLARIPDFREKLARFIRSQTEDGRRVVLLGQIPRFPANPNRFAFVSRRLGVEEPEWIPDPAVPAANEVFRELVATIEGASFVDLAAEVCAGDDCSPFTSEGVVRYLDEDHVNLLGSRQLAASPRLRAALAL